MPAACMGIFTIRPSCGRFPKFWSRACLEGQETVQGVIGPMAKSLEEIILLTRVVIDQSPWIYDPGCLPIPWRCVEAKEPLKIAVLWNDGVVTPTPPVSRALKETVEKLEAAGHTTITWEPTEHMEMLVLLREFFLADGGKSIRKLIDPTGEPFRPEMKEYEMAKEIGVYDLWQMQAQRNTLCKSYLDRWNEIGIDAIICKSSTSKVCIVY